jgi:hypothetical protein
MAVVGLLIMRLSSVLATQAIALSQLYLPNSPRTPSLIEQRRLEAMLAAQPPGGEVTRIDLSEPPTLPANILAAQLDLAERDPASSTRFASFVEGSPEPTLQSSSIATSVYSYETTSGSGNRPKLRTLRSHSTAAVSARDVFNRNFGVLSMAANY